jgi:hypothetical protein
MKNNILIKVLIRLFKLCFKIDFSYEIKEYIKFITDLRKKSGLKYTIKYLKASKLHITRILCNKPLKSNDAGVSLDSDGFPKRLFFLKK